MLSKNDFVEKKIIVIYTKNGEKISFKNDNIVVIDSEDKIKFQMSCYRLFVIFIVGGISLTTGIIQKSKKFGFSIVLFTNNFKIYETINFKMEGNTLLRKIQYSIDNNDEIGKEIIINKIENQKKVLQMQRDNKNVEGIRILNENIERLSKGSNYDSYQIMGIEGICSKVYFNRLFKNDLEWKGRQPRVKRDKINLLLDIGYTVLFNYIEAIVNIYGFDVYKGNLHREFYKRKSLICDLIEPFRPIIDNRVKKCFTLGQVKKYKFVVDNGQYQMNWKDSSEFVQLILEEIMEYKICIFKYIQEYYRWNMKRNNINIFPKVRLEKNDTFEL